MMLKTSSGREKTPQENEIPKIWIQFLLVINYRKFSNSNLYSKISFSFLFKKTCF